MEKETKKLATVTPVYCSPARSATEGFAVSPTAAIDNWCSRRLSTNGLGRDLPTRTLEPNSAAAPYVAPSKATDAQVGLRTMSAG